MKSLRLLVLAAMIGLCCGHAVAQYGGQGAYGSTEKYLQHVGTSIIPAADETYDLGSSSKAFDNAYVGDLSVSGTLDVGGTLYLSDGTPVNGASDLGAFDPNIDGAIYVNGNIYVGSPSLTSVTPSGDDLMVAGDAEVDGALYVDGFLYGNGSQLTGISAGSENWTDSGSDVYTYGNVGINTTDVDDILNVLAEGTGGITVDAVTTSQTLVAQGTGTPIGNMTAGGGLAIFFDGVKLTSSSAQRTGTSGNVGKDWGAGNTKTITGFNAYSTGWGFVNAYSGAATLTLQGSTDNFSSSVVTLGVLSFSDLQTYQTESKTTGIDISTAYRYHRILINASGNPNTEYGGTEIEFLEGGGIANPSVTFDSLGTTYGAVGLDASSNVTISNGTGAVVAITQSNNVGIGTTNPIVKLHVSGSIYATFGMLTPSGTIGLTGSCSNVRYQGGVPYGCLD